MFELPSRERDIIRIGSHRRTSTAPLREASSPKTCWTLLTAALRNGLEWTRGSRNSGESVNSGVDRRHGDVDR